MKEFNLEDIRSHADVILHELHTEIIECIKKGSIAIAGLPSNENEVTDEYNALLERKEILEEFSELKKKFQWQAVMAMMGFQSINPNTRDSKANNLDDEVLEALDKIEANNFLDKGKKKVVSITFRDSAKGARSARLNGNYDTLATYYTQAIKDYYELYQVVTNLEEFTDNMRRFVNQSEN